MEPVRIKWIRSLTAGDSTLTKFCRVHAHLPKAPRKPESTICGGVLVCSSQYMALTTPMHFRWAIGGGDASGACAATSPTTGTPPTATPTATTTMMRGDRRGS